MPTKITTRAAASQRMGRRAAARRRALPALETYSNRRIAEFLLNNAVDAKDYEIACRDVRKLGLDPAKVRHVKPPDVA
jgi:hypothetical protein